MGELGLAVSAVLSVFAQTFLPWVCFEFWVLVAGTPSSGSVALHVSVCPLLSFVVLGDSMLPGELLIDTFGELHDSHSCQFH